MARTKSNVLDTRASPPPAQLPAIAPSDSIPTSAPSGSASSITEKTTCQNGNTSMSTMPIEDFESHVATCTGTSNPSDTPSKSTTSALSSPPRTPFVHQPVAQDMEALEPVVVVPEELPTQPEDTPTTPDIPVDLKEIPAGPEGLSAVPAELPAGLEEVSAGPEEVPANPEEVLAGPEESPARSGDSVVVLNNSPTRTEALPVQHAVPAAAEEVVGAGHKDLSEEDLDCESDVSEVGTLLAYVKGEYVFYDSEEDDEESATETVSKIPSIISSGKSSARSSPKSSRQSSVTFSEAEEPQFPRGPNGAQNSKKSQPSGTPTDDDAPQPSQSSEIPDVVVTEVFANSATPKVYKSILKNSSGQDQQHVRSGSMSKSHRSGSIPRSVRSGSIPQVTEIRQKKKKVPAKHPFLKMTPTADFEEYLAKPEEMSYEQLYHRTAVVAKALLILQNEYDELDKKTGDYDAAKKNQAKIAAETKKEQDDKEAAETDAILLQLHAQYREEVKQPLKDYNIWLDQLQAASTPENTPPGHWEYMKQIKNPEVMSKVHKRRKQLEKLEAKPAHILEDTPFPALRKCDEEVRKKRHILLDPVVFEDRKTADVYMADYSKHKDAIGYQVLKDRRLVHVTEEKDENGRPKRSRGKRAYDTEQTNTPGGSESEEAPLGKRRRTARVVQDLPTSPARRRTATREGSPKVSVFPKSGKRIGRPPKSKGEILPPMPKSASKSKLQQSHLPPASEAARTSDSEDELASAQTPRDLTPRELEPIEEAQLQEAAESLVQQTQAVTAAPVKPKHAGGRPKKATLLLNVKSGDQAPEVKASPKKGGRAAAKPKAARGGRAKKEVAAPIEQVRLVEENDVIQSTEQDDESRFASASTSRPTTSSVMTTSTGRASRAASRAATRELSLQPGAITGATGSSTAKGRGGKRKRVVENGAPEPVQPAGSVPKKRKTAAKKQETIQEVDEQPFTPETTGEVIAAGSTTASGRPKRKKAAPPPDSIYVALPGDEEDFAQDDDSDSPPQKRRKGGKTARPAKKGKSAKEEATESEYFSEAVEDAPQPKKHMIRFAYAGRVLGQAPAGFPSDFDISDQSASEPMQPRPKIKGKGKVMGQYASNTGGNSSAANDSVTPHLTPHQGSEIPSGLQTGDETDVLSMNSKTGSKKGKSKAASYTPNLESGAEQSGHDGDGEDGGRVVDEEVRKRQQKSRKLAEATRERWAKGLMKGPMEKRAATNAAKKAAKDAAKGGVPNGGVPPSSFTPNPFFTAPPNPSVPMTFDNPPTFAAAPQNPFSNPTANSADMFASLDAIAYHGAPHLPTTFVPVTIAPANPSPRKPRAPAKKRKTATKAIKTEDTTAAASPSQQNPCQQPDSIASTSAANTHTNTSASTSAPAPTRGSKRVHKPTHLALGMDGAGDEEEMKFRSEYDRYQALTSPRSPLTLGKRKRKSIMDLSAMRDDDDDDDDSF